ncbi:anthranilate phosphoribosyltransferase [Nostoc sp. CHAB 5844]|nr:anthranilate phosphoribosyltransferase [Nostoc sp. CHAB 5844]
MTNFATYVATPEKVLLWSEFVEELIEGQSLSHSQATKLMQGWYDGTIPPMLTGAILTILQMKGLTAEELTNTIQSLLSYSSLLTATSQNKSSLLSDICYIGEDRNSSFTISIAVAFVAAAAGVPVAKYGDNSVSRCAGFADLLEVLGVNLQNTIDKIQAAIPEVGITFLLASSVYPIFKTLAPLRQVIQVETVFNLLGSLANPLRPTGQVIILTKTHLLKIITQTLRKLGTQQAIVLCEREQLNEARLAQITDLAILFNGQVHIENLKLQELGLQFAPMRSLEWGNVQDNAEILRSVLQGRGTQAQQDVVTFNAALALQVGGVVPLGNHAYGICIAKEILRSGAAWSKLEELIKFFK